MAAYDAFISYSHGKDKPIAAALQGVVQKLGKPWYRRRALRVFRDDTSLSATPHLWPSIEEALAQSRYFVLLASPEAAVSRWVNKEVTYWLDHNSPSTLLIGLTEGELAWDEERGAFVSPTALPVPPALAGRLPSEPKWVDLRGYREAASPRGSKFIEAGADFAAAIRGIPKEDLLSQELRQQRRALTLAYSGVATLAVLIVIAGWQWRVALKNEKLAVANERAATEQKQIAQQQRDRAEKTLATATRTANDMVFKLAQDFRDETGMPLHLMRRILDSARSLQDQLTQSGETSPELKRTEEVAIGELMMTYLAQGDAKAALDAAERAVSIAQALVQIDPQNALWQDDLNVTYSRLGDALMASGRRADAFAAYRKALALSDKLAAAAPDDANAHRRLSIDYSKLGNAFNAEGNRAEALAYYQKALAILQRFGESDAAWQWSLSIAHGKIGEISLVSNRADEALQEFRTAVDLMRKVVLAMPLDVRAQRELATTYEQVGRALLMLGRAEEAVDAQEANVRIAREVAASDPANMERQAMLSSSYEMYFQALRKAGRTEQAGDILTKLVAIREKVASADPANTRPQVLLGIAYFYAGNSLAEKKQRRDALAYYRKSLDIYKKLNLLDPDNIDWSNNLSLAFAAVARILRETGQLEEALKNSDEDLKLVEAVANKAPNDPYYAANLAVSYLERGKLLFALGRAEEGLAYLDEALRMAASKKVLPAAKDEAWMHWFRGMVRLSLQEPQLALEDMQRAIELDPHEAYHAIALHLVHSRLHQEDKDELAANAAKMDVNKWPGPLIAFFSGKSTLQEVNAVTRAAKDERTSAEQACEADFYVGMSRLSAPSEARPLLEAAAKFPQQIAEGNWAAFLAASFLKQLDTRVQQTTAIPVVQCDRLAGSDLDPQKPASIPGIPVSALNPRLAVPACEAAVKAAPGDARMIFQLGRAYAAAKAYDKARELYEQADALGHGLATNNLGALYADGWGVARDLAKARSYYLKAAQAGVPLAMYNFGSMAERGQGGAQDYAEARHWYEKAAAAGFPRGAYGLGVLYQHGRGVQKDLNQARRWYESAAEHGYDWGMLDMGFLYERGEGVAVDYARAREWYEKAAAAGNGLAMSNIGVLYARGWGVPQDYTMARRWYERSAAAGNAAGMHNLGLIYHYGRAVPVDYAAARSWYEKTLAADPNFTLAMLTLGSLYEEGHGAPRDVAEARRWYEKALAAGNQDAAKRLERLQKVSETKK
jgi:TPR repeat protein/aromatic ring-opening dioxygenase LigB subunit